MSEQEQVNKNDDKERQNRLRQVEIERPLEDRKREVREYLTVKSQQMRERLQKDYHLMTSYRLSGARVLSTIIADQLESFAKEIERSADKP